MPLLQGLHLQKHLKTMKNLKSYLASVVLFLMAVCILSACTDDAPELPQSATHEGRGLVTDLTASVSNPDLISNWENVTEIMINQPGTGGADLFVTAPWATGASTRLSTDFCTDIKQADGWMMLFHTFKEKGLDPKQNYICFYNLFTGVLKVFYYFEGGATATNTTWYMKAENTSPFKTLDAPSYFSLPDSEPSANTSNQLLFMNESIIEPNALEIGWNGFEYQIPRYSTDLSKCRFTIGAYSQNIQNVTINGDAHLGTSGVVNSVTTNYSQQQRQGVDGVATYAGGKAEEYLAHELRKDGQSRLLETLVGAVSSFGGSFVKTLVGKGLGFIFGRTTVATNYYTTSDVRLNTMGNIYYNGTISQTNNAGIPPITFDLWSILNPYTATIDPNPWILNSLVTPVVPLPQYLRDLGTWTVTQKPVVYWNLCYPFTLTEFSDVEAEFFGTALTSKITRCDFNVKFNPYIENYITSSSVDVKVLAYRGPISGTFIDRYAPEIEVDTTQQSSDSQHSNILRAHFEPFDRTPGAFGDGVREYHYLPAQRVKDCYVIGDLRPDEYNEDTEWYVNWEVPRDCMRVALITVTMNVKYYNHSFEVKETRQYLCDDRVEQSSLNLAARHDPPKCVVLVPGNSWILNRY